jgi:hypothetical protein
MSSSLLMARGVLESWVKTTPENTILGTPKQQMHDLETKNEAFFL